MKKIDETRTSRASQTRDKSSKKKVWTTQSNLDAKQAATGWQHRWLRAETRGRNEEKTNQDR